jgi:hypothetical protein
VAWRSADGFDWKYVGTITDAEDMMAEPTRSLGGNTEENDLALMADGKTIMIVMRTDGDCGCKQANGRGACGLYRPYFQSHSSDMGKTWSWASPIPGTGCARPRLLSLGLGRPMLISGGRMCWANTTGLFVWVNPTGMPNQEWSRYRPPMDSPCDSDRSVYCFCHAHGLTVLLPSGIRLGIVCTLRTLPGDTEIHAFISRLPSSVAALLSSPMY